jgi:tRNA (guanine37-N1)-methyltransferase
MALKDLLKEKLTKEELSLLPKSFDIIGNREKAVAIIDLDEKIMEKKEIARALMKQHKNVKSVLLKKSPRKGTHRINEYELLSGEKNTEVLHIEHGLKYKIDPVSTYFSPREGTERERILKFIKKDQNVMVFFAGAGPLAIIISKKTQAKNIVGIEINPKAVDYFIENVNLNKIKNITIIESDVKKLNLDPDYDHVFMPLPESAFSYLSEAMKCLKPKGIIHLYCFSLENKIEEMKKEIEKNAEGKVKFLEIQKVLPYGPGIWKYRISFQFS